MIDPLMESFTKVAATGIQSGLEVGKADRERLERERDELLEALRDLVCATEDTLQVHPETACCSVTRNACLYARALLAKYPPKKDVNNA